MKVTSLLNPTLYSPTKSIEFVVVELNMNIDILISVVKAQSLLWDKSLNNNLIENAPFDKRVLNNGCTDIFPFFSFLKNSSYDMYKIIISSIVIC